MNIKTSFLTRSVLAYTLTEIMISSALLTLVISGVVVIHIFGLKMAEITRTKLGASDGARKALSKIAGEVRSAETISVGTGNATNFTEANDGDLQQGNAMKIFPTTNDTPFVIYYLDDANDRLMRTTDANKSSVIATGISNTVLFTSEDYTGTVITNSENNRVIGLNIIFSEIQYPVVKIGTNQFYDYYRYRVRVTRRSI